MTKSDDNAMGCLLWLGIIMMMMGFAFLFGPVSIVIGGLLFIILAFVLYR